MAAPRGRCAVDGKFLKLPLLPAVDRGRRDQGISLGIDEILLRRGLGVCLVRRRRIETWYGDRGESPTETSPLEMGEPQAEALAWGSMRLAKGTVMGMRCPPNSTVSKQRERKISNGELN